MSGFGLKTTRLGDMYDTEFRCGSSEKRKDVGMVGGGGRNKLNILFIFFFPVIDPTLTLQSNTNKAKRESDRERKKKEQFITLISQNIPQQLTRRTTACHTYREKYTRVSPRQHDDYKKGFRLTSCFNQTECDKQTIQTEKTWCCAQRRGGAGWGQRGDAYSRTASGRGPIFKNDTSPWRTRCLAKVCGTRREGGGGEGLPFKKKNSSCGGGGSSESHKMWRQIPAAVPQPGSMCARSSAVKQHALECVCVCMCVETKLHLIQGSRHNSFLFIFCYFLYTRRFADVFFFLTSPQ